MLESRDVRVMGDDGKGKEGIKVFLTIGNLEPGLALMDEIGRQALTNAFINFNRSPCDPKAYRDSLIYDGCVVSEVDNELLTVEETRSKDQLELPLVAQAIPKCPSAPDIAHNKLDPNAEIRPEVQEYIKEQAQELQSASHKQERCV